MLLKLENLTSRVNMHMHDYRHACTW